MRRPRPHFLLKSGSVSFSLGKETKIMGILNLTPDSFSGDGLSKHSATKTIQLARRLVKKGADILDIGGESTRPGAKPVSAKEEIARIKPAVLALLKEGIPVSIDTYKPAVAKWALDCGAHMINNIKATTASKSFLRMIRNYNAAIVLMHMRGTPSTMQKKIAYKNVSKETIAELRKPLENCLEIGIKSDRILIDPGIGFGKTAEHNLEILAHLADFQALHQPILVGTSRKFFIGKILNQEPHNRLNGTLASVCCAILNGAHILRVHDVKAVKEAALVTDAILNS